MYVCMSCVYMYVFLVIFKGDSSSHLISDPQISHCVSIKALESVYYYSELYVPYSI